MSKAIMIQGTGSGAGKSVIVAGLCRIFRDLGIKVAPFKGQNMALNSFITKEGGEIGRAQAFQAESAGIEPSNDMNPVLLKAKSETGCQVILNGKVYANMKATDYYDIKKKAWDTVTAAYDRLAEEYDLIVIEGAGSPAEINLREEEVVNMKVARYADASVILVGDIDKGGVFAAFHGTVELLKDGINGQPPPEKTDADYIKAFIVNKFRGDIDILRPGLRLIEDKTGKPVIGTLHYMGDLGLDEEDAIPVERMATKYRSDIHKPIKIVVLALRYISNFTDFDPFIYEDDVEIKYSLEEADINSADLIIIPGSKNTVSDLLYLRKNGIETAVKTAARNGTSLVGVCGGYQMLGTKILDPFGVESDKKEISGMGLLDIVTTLDKTKTTCQVTASITSPKWFDAVESTTTCRWNNLKGYEIHMGNTTGDVGLFQINQSSFNSKLKTQNLPTGQAGSKLILDGSVKDNVWGTYIHGIFDNNGLRTALINSLRMKKGLDPRESTVNYSAEKEKAIDRWADILKSKIDMCFILRQVGMEACIKKL